MVPKIDYKLIGEAVAFYESIGFTYVEVPWAVSEDAIRATLPHPFPAMELGRDHGDRGLSVMYPWTNYLVGSAEQGFLTLDLEEGAYVGVTPCFRIEDENDILRQDMFMKVELFDNRPKATVAQTLTAAERFFRDQLNPVFFRPKSLQRVETPFGYDLELGGIEIGSYGERSHPDLGRWVYGTGLACPRFSVAKALSSVF